MKLKGNWTKNNGCVGHQEFLPMDRITSNTMYRDSLTSYKIRQQEIRQRIKYGEISGIVRDRFMGSLIKTIEMLDIMSKCKSPYTILNKHR